MHLDRAVGHIALDICLGLQLQQLAGHHRALDAAVDDHVVRFDGALDRGHLAHDEQTGPIHRPHVAHDLAVDAKPFGEQQVPLDSGALGDQALDRGLLGLAGEHANLLSTTLDQGSKV